MEPISKKLNYDFRESFKIEAFISEAWHKLISLSSSAEFMCEKINKLFEVFWFPIVWAEESYEIVLQQVAFLVLIKRNKDILKHILIDHEAW